VISFHPSQLSRVPVEPDVPRLTWSALLGASAVAVQLVLVWGFDFFPSVDGPAHVHLAHAMYEALTGDPFYRDLVEFNSRVNPNVATQSMLIALMAVAPPFVAEKIWLSFYFASFAAAAAYALAGINGRSLCLLPLFVFCSISFPLAFGFYNFAFSSVVFLAWFGFWWRHRNAPGVAVTLGHAAFAVAAYATHVFAFVVTLFGIGTAILANSLLQIGRDPRSAFAHPGTWLRPMMSQALPPLLGSLPVLAACVHFLFFRFGSGTRAGAAGLKIPLPDRFEDLLTASTFAPYDSEESFAARGFVLVLLLLTAYLWRHRKKGNFATPLAASFGAFLILYLLMPETWIVRWMPSRFLPMVFIALLLWLAALMPTSMKRAHWWAISAIGFLVLFGSAVVRIGIFSHLDGLYREYASAAPHIARNSTLIGLRLHNTFQGRPFPAKMDVLIQAGSRLASIRHSVELKNFQGQSSDHPVQFRPGVGASAALGGDSAIISLSSRIKLMEYERQTGRAIDYVLLYGYRDAVFSTDALARIDAQLEGNYRLVFVSQPTSFVHLYKRSSVESINRAGLGMGGPGREGDVDGEKSVESANVGNPSS